MEQNKSKAEEIRWLFKKFEKAKEKYQTSNFEEPIAILLRRNGRISFFEKATKGSFDFEHSDGTERTIYLDPKWLKTFPYGEKEFRGYILDEDSPTPLPSNPVTTAEQVNIVVEKSMQDLQNLKAKEITAKAGLVKTIGMVIGGIILLAILWRMLVPKGDVSTPVAATQAAVETVRNNVTSQSISILT